MKLVRRKILLILVIPIFLVGALSAGYFYLFHGSIKGSQTAADPEYAFIAETYDTVKNNYWNKLSDEQLTNLYVLAAGKLVGSPQQALPAGKDGIRTMWQKISSKLSADKKKELAVNLNAVVLANLEPFGRSALYTQKDQENLQNRVENVNPQSNLYSDLGVGKEASQSQIEAAYKAQVATLSAQNSTQSQEKLKQVTYAHEVLSNSLNKQIYDTTGAEPTVFAKLINPSVAYIKIKQMSPETLQEFVNEANGLTGTSSLNSLILDLRGNVGGSIDILPYFLGPFIGSERYAYDFYHEGEKVPHKTQTGFLPSLFKYKKVVILIDGNTQSTAEVMAATLKEYNVGVLVGEKTRGWGTVEKVFPLASQIDKSEHYSVFLVHSLTLRDDGQPIEGNGVEPLINIKSDWAVQLNAYYNFTPLVDAVRQVYSKNPWQ